MRMKGYASSLDVQCLRIELKTMYLNQGSLFRSLSQELDSIKGHLRHQEREVLQELGSVDGGKAEHWHNTKEDHKAPFLPKMVDDVFASEVSSISC
mmetsp:Transcript_27268/g.63531  ORF Transcript_27268/g.63531 Transcript_27268/m.63531 type:complete len:96 (-) Transcript_27268:108-395(-)